MTEQEKTEKRKKTVKRVWDGSKLVMAIGALTAAINAYADLSEKSVKLSEQNAALYKALSSKVNGMAERLAYIEGRIDGLNSEEAREAVKDKIKPKPARAPASFEMGGGAPLEGLMDDEPTATAAAPVPEEDDVEVEAAAEAPPPPKPPKPRPQRQSQVQYQAYEELPDNLEALMQEQVQVQEEM